MDFEQLLKENKVILETYLKYRVSSYADREDLLQEICLKAYEKFSDLKQESSFKAWLITIARNRINDFYRQKAKEEFVVLEEDFPAVSIQRSVNEKVYDTLYSLPEKEQQLLKLFYWQDYSLKEISRQWGIPEGTIKSRLYQARKHFKERYPKEEKMKTVRIPEILPDYTITEIKDEPFEVLWVELMGWFLIPKEGNHLTFGIYDFPDRSCSEYFDLYCQGKAEIHGLQGVKVYATETSKDGKEIKREFIAQLTDTHCRYLAESHEENGVQKYYTFLDGDVFLNNWGFGEENIGNETHLKQKGKITRKGNSITVDSDREVMDVVGRYKVSINGKAYDTICLMDIGLYDENTYSEQYIDRNGRTVLWRRFNRKNQRWLFDGFEELPEEKLEKNEKIIVNGTICYHWYDCITDYIL